MHLETRSSRRVAAGAGLTALVAAAVLAFRGFSEPWAPQAPEYRQKGPAGAPVVITDFSDFQCGGCAAAAGPLKRLQALYPEKVRVVFKHHPWPFHKNARSAAIAAECAGRVAGKFWEYHDFLFASMAEWHGLEQPRGHFASGAKGLGIDAAAFGACLDSPEAAALVDADAREAKEERWVRSTPTFFINGERFIGARQLQTYGLNRVEDLLKR